MQYVKEDFENTLCPLCGENNIQLLSKEGEWGIPVFVALCKNDGMVYLNPRWTKPRYHKFYSEEYDQYYRSNQLQFKKGGDENYMYANTFEIIDRLERAGIDLSQINSVLDIGAGIGWSLKYFKEKKNIANIAAIEPSIECKNYLENEIGAEVIHNDVDADWHIGQENKYDLVIMRHVLEHFLDPQEVLSKAEKVLSDKGVLYVGVPDMMNPMRSLKKFWYRVVHTFYFTGKSLTYIGSKVGLENIFEEHHPKKSDFAILFKRNKTFKYPLDFKKHKEEVETAISAYKSKYFFQKIKDILLFFPRKAKRAIGK